MVTIENAAIYSMSSEMAFELTYSTGDKVRAVLARNGWIRKEYRNTEGAWVLSGKPYVVKRNAERQAEKLMRRAKKFLTT